MRYSSKDTTRHLSDFFWSGPASPEEKKKTGCTYLYWIECIERGSRSQIERSVRVDVDVDVDVDADVHAVPPCWSLVFGQASFPRALDVPVSPCRRRRTARCLKGEGDGFFIGFGRYKGVLVLILPLSSSPLSCAPSCLMFEMFSRSSADCCLLSVPERPPSHTSLRLMMCFLANDLPIVLYRSDNR